MSRFLYAIQQGPSAAGVEQWTHSVTREHDHVSPFLAGYLGLQGELETSLRDHGLNIRALQRDPRVHGLPRNRNRSVWEKPRGMLPLVSKPRAMIGSLDARSDMDSHASDESCSLNIGLGRKDSSLSMSPGSSSRSPHVDGLGAWSPATCTYHEDSAVARVYDRSGLFNSKCTVSQVGSSLSVNPKFPCQGPLPASSCRGTVKRVRFSSEIAFWFPEQPGDLHQARNPSVSD